ncbi:calcium-binding protein [Azospirillum sp. RWY-5-1]|uniref:Calcium-binding protein n=1 Tax=Azospirillum oleiclasticum TaxID=2735135 RepID=A0ABX2TJW7_9PROT|nr:calcium-binding protein [Azospirillum oleiclasticum]NYZ17543.1 calcium-binding protein [Azospirillum oleiclasticum]NYZ24645.1 calcium-binding protein [Azospirillum oleiclasticum]
MAQLVAGAGFALDFTEDRAAGGYLLDGFRLDASGNVLATGAGALSLVGQTAWRWHRTVLDYAGQAGAGGTVDARFTGFTDHDPTGAVRYRIAGLDIALGSNALDRLGAELFAAVDTVIGGDGDDSFYMGVAVGRRFDGGNGGDRAIYGADTRRYVWRDGAYRAAVPVIVALAPGVYGAMSADGAMDTLVNVETVTLAGQTSAIAAVAFDGLSYLAANPDVAGAVGLNLVAATAHYAAWGRNERRATGFDALAYGAANPDLAAAFGTDAALLATHYVRNGRLEGRSTSFDALAYGAANPDLAAAFGADTALLAAHYIRNGRLEGRSTSFDARAYLAANPDVAAAFGTDTTAATRHYLLFGWREGRPLRTGAALPAATLTSAMTPSLIEAVEPEAGDAVVARLVSTITGTTGNDTLTGNPATDALGDSQTDLVLGLAGIDSFVLTGAIALYGFTLDGSGRVVVSGPDGTDVLSGVELLQATDGTRPVSTLIVPTEPTFTGLTFTTTATSGDDVLAGTDRADVLGGGLGNDILAGGFGNDTMLGHEGNDRLHGEDGNDSLSGGAGNDRLYGGFGNDRLTGDPIGITGNDTLLGGAGDDILDAGNGNDVLDGGTEADTLYGGYGADLLRGGDGADILYGDVYSDRSITILTTATDLMDDVLAGGAGNDVLHGGAGADLLDGGTGADRFIIANLNESTTAAPDVIVNFNGDAVAAAALLGLASYATRGAEGDRIDLSEIDASILASGNGTFTFIGTDAFSAAGQVRYQASGTVTLIEANVDATLTADLRVQVNIANYSFTAYDFIL